MKKKKIINLLFIGFKHCPQFYVPSLFLMIILGLGTPVIVNIQANIINTASSSSEYILKILFSSFIIYFVLSFMQNIGRSRRNIKSA